MKPNKVIFPPGSSSGGRGGTGPPAEVNFHGNPEPPPLPAIPEMERNGRLQTRGDPPGTVDEGVRTRSKRSLSGSPTARLANASKRPERKRTVDYEHRPLSPPGGGWREHAQDPPSSWAGSIPPGHNIPPWGDPPGAPQDSSHSLSAGRQRCKCFAAQLETHGKDAVMNNANQGR